MLKYIPPVTLFSGAFVGLLAAGADLLGTVGNATSTGLLLAVGIILRTYEQIQKEQAMEMSVSEFFGRTRALRGKRPHPPRHVLIRHEGRRDAASVALETEHLVP